MTWVEHLIPANIQGLQRFALPWISSVLSETLVATCDQLALKMNPSASPPGSSKSLEEKARPAVLCRQPGTDWQKHGCGPALCPDSRMTLWLHLQPGDGGGTELNGIKLYSIPGV